MAWATTTIDAFLPDVRADIPSAPEAALLHHIRNSVLDFCSRSLYWREELGPLAFSDVTETLEFAVPEGLDIRQVTAMELSDDETELFVKVAVVPERNTDIVAQLIVDRWYDAIVSGAKGRLMMMPQKEWTDPALATLYRQHFESSVLAARREASNGFNTVFRNPGMTYSDF